MTWQVRFHPDVLRVDIPKLARIYRDPAIYATVVARIRKALDEVGRDPHHVGAPLRKPPLAGWRKFKFHLAMAQCFFLGLFLAGAVGLVSPRVEGGPSWTQPVQVVQGLAFGTSVLLLFADASSGVALRGERAMRLLL